MAAMSLLRVVAQGNGSRLKMVPCPLQMQSIRGGHGRVLEIHPSTYSWFQFKDSVHFYFLIGLIPLTLFATYENLRYGRSVLTDTPENYEPTYYEYERHPVTRWLCWLVDKHPRYDHERRMDLFNHEAEKVMLRRIEKQVRAVMQVRGDHKSFYYQPNWQAKTDRVRRKVTETNSEREGFMDSHYIVGGELVDHQHPNQPSSRHQSIRGGGPAFAEDKE